MNLVLIKRSLNVFVSETVKINRYNYQFEENYIEELFKKALNKNIKSLVLCQDHLKPLRNNSWIKYSQKQNLNLIIAKKAHLLSPIHEHKLPFLFASFNNQEHNTIKRLSSILKKQQFPYLNAEAFSYLERQELSIWFIEDDYVKDYFTGNILGDSPKLPTHNHDLELLSTFNNKEICSFSQFFHSTANLPKKLSEWSSDEETIRGFKDYIVSNYPITNLPYEERIIAELDWIEENNLSLPFLAAIKFNDSKLPYDYKGDFKRFILSYHIGIAKNSPRHLFDLSNRSTPELIFFTTLSNKKLLLDNLRSFLSEANMVFKFPFQKDNILFSTILDWFKKPENVNEFNMETLILYKDIYDELPTEKKLTFFEDMRLFFLLNAEAKIAFKHALFLLKKQVYQTQPQFNKIAIIDPLAFESKDETIFVGIDELKDRCIPMITLNFNKRQNP